jgi:cytochrome c553
MVTPNIVSDWQLSKHRQNGVDCSVCQGDRHTSAKDVASVLVPTLETCSTCHETQVEQFKGGKHA